MASSSHSSAFGAQQSAFLSVDPYRDRAGFLPLVACPKCGTKLIGRVSQKAGSKGKRFYKCPLLEHTDFACDVYYFEEHYVEFLVSRGHLPRGCSKVRARDAMALEVVQPSIDTGKYCHGLEQCTDMLQSAVIHLNGSETTMKALLDSHSTLEKKIEKIGSQLLVVVAAILFVLVLVLLVLLVK